MKCSQHFVFAMLVGITQYLLITGLSYLLAFLQTPTSIYIAEIVLSHCLVAFVAVWNVIYRVESFRWIFVHMMICAMTYFATTLLFAHTGVILYLEEVLLVPSGTQNVQGMIMFSFLVCGITVSVIAAILKGITFLKKPKDHSI